MLGSISIGMGRYVIITSGKYSKGVAVVSAEEQDQDYNEKTRKALHCRLNVRTISQMGRIQRKVQ